MKDTLIRNWVPGDRKLGIESKLKAPVAEKKEPPNMEAVFSIVAEYMDSMNKKDGKYLKRTLGDDRIELLGPGAAIRLPVKDFEEIHRLITEHVANNQSAS